jgi:tRNA threonylcarbamoyladenosine biosynthesis protein TsaB
MTQPHLRLLALETSGQQGSVALGHGDTVIERTIATAREQTSTVLALVDEVLGEAGLALAELDALVFGRGPGSFTGLRVAAAVAQGLSLASGRPIVPVSSLAALAAHGLAGHAAKVRASTAGPGNEVVALCCVDARMGEVYTGRYRRDAGSGLVSLSGAEAIGRPEAVERPAGPFIALGDGWTAYAAELESVARAALDVDPARVPRARDLLPLAAADVRAGRFAPLEAALPVYLREADAWRRI